MRRFDRSLESTDAYRANFDRAFAKNAGLSDVEVAEIKQKLAKQTDEPLTALSVIGDTIYIGTTHGVYTAKRRKPPKAARRTAHDPR